MKEKFSECQTPFTKCWCEAVPGRMNNPHCKDAVDSLPIQSDVLTIILVLAIFAYVYNIFKIKL